MAIALALQGGGAHGAYTWGVLDRLLEVPGLQIHAISGASAGAVNAVALAEGWRIGGAQGARNKLSAIWHAIARKEPTALWFGLALPYERNHLLHHAALKNAFAWMSWMSPEQLNPLALDPLRDVLDQAIDFSALAKSSGMDLFVSATDVALRSARIFRRREISRDVILASSCLPTLHRGVTIEDRLYWDGGFTANPPLWPLITEAKARHIVLVRLTGEAMTASLHGLPEIRATMSELSFEAPLTAELASIRAAQKHVMPHWLSFGGLDKRLSQLRLETIGSPEWLGQFDPVSKADTALEFLEKLCEAGRLAASDWLGAQGAKAA